MYGFVNGCSRKTYVCSVRQCIPQIFGKAICDFRSYLVGISFGLDGQFRTYIVLGAMRFIT